MTITYIVLCLVFALISVTWAKNENYTFTYSMAMRCSEHLCQHGYSYDSFYRIDESSLRYTKVQKEGAAASYFEMHIAIQAASNGHILLSPTAYPSGTDPVYEIVVGGGGNKFTELRRNLKTNARSSAKTAKILSPIEFTAFFIKITEDGLVEFGREGDSLPILSFYDADVLPIKYFSFAAWNGVEAKFLYDCPAPGDTDAISLNSQVVEPKLSSSEELRRSLLTSKPPSVAPGPDVPVNLTLEVTHVGYNAMTTMMYTNMVVVTTWTDPTLAWNPAKFNGTTSLKFRQGEIWRPMFFVYNSDGTETFDSRDADLITTQFSGESNFRFQTEVQTWCMGSYAGSNKWPHDEYSCSIVIEPWEVHEKISIAGVNETVIKTLEFSEWMVAYQTLVIKPDYWYHFINNNDNQTHQSDRTILSVDLVRMATTYNIGFYTPLLVLVVFILLSFWSEPLGPFREWFYAGCTIIICVFLSGIDRLVPTHTVPSILILYTTVMYGVLIALLIHVFLVSPVATYFCKTKAIQSIFTCWLFRVVFFLPPVKITFSGDYLRQEDDEEEGTTSNVEEMERDNEKIYGDPKELSEVLDAIMVVVYTITFAVMMGDHY